MEFLYFKVPKYSLLTPVFLLIDTDGAKTGSDCLFFENQENSDLVLKT